VDAIRVVRCKDCIYFENSGVCTGRGIDCFTNPMDFCSNGEKKKDN
jgi:hypothetical protein